MGGYDPKRAMNITEIRIKLVGENKERLRAFCSITLDGAIVIRDLKIIDGVSGPFVAMPSRKLSDHCRQCGHKNHLRARYCNDCGAHLPENRADTDEQGRIKLHADIAHPINSAAREELQRKVIEAYEEEFRRSKLPGYEPPTYDHDPVGEDLESAHACSSTAHRSHRDGPRPGTQRSADRPPRSPSAGPSPPENFGPPRSGPPRRESPQPAASRPGVGDEDAFSAGIG